MPRREDNTVAPCIHPRELRRFIARSNEAVGIHANVVFSAVSVGSDDGTTGVQKLWGRIIVIAAGVSAIFVRCMHKPQAGVNGVVVAARTVLIKIVGNQSVAKMARKCQQRGWRLVDLARTQQKSRQADHRVASPITEPRITSDDGGEPLLADQTLYDKIICSSLQS